MTAELLTAALEATDILILSRDETVRHLFENAGFRKIKTLRQSIDDALMIIRAGQCDVVVLDDLFLEEKTVDFIKSIRSGEYGSNICLPIVILISDASNDIGREAVQVGADDVVLKPLSVNDVNKRMRALLTRDLMYVVTSNYVGPNRRSVERTNPDRDNLVSIPNAMRLKAEGHQETMSHISEMMSNANRAINNISAALEGEVIQKLIDDAIANPKDFQPALRRLSPIVQSFAKKLAKTDFEHIGDLSKLILDIIGEIKGPPDPKSTEILNLVSQALRLSFEDDKQSKAAASEIITLLKNR